MRGLAVLFYFLAGLFAFAVGSMVLAIFLPTFLARSRDLEWGLVQNPDWGALFIFGGIVGALVILVMILSLVAVRSVRRGTSSKESGMDIEQTRIVQEIYQGLSQMERRIESLETLLLDRNRSGETLYKD